MTDNNHLNFKRLKTIRNNLAESISDLNRIRFKLSSIEDKDVKSGLVNSLRLSLVQIKEELSRYVSAVLKSSLIAVNEYSSFNESIEKCIELGYMPNLDREVIKLLVSYRNASCHRYKEPSASLLFDFIDNKLIKIEELVFFIDRVIECGGPINTENSSLKTSNNW